MRVQATWVTHLMGAFNRRADSDDLSCCLVGAQKMQRPWLGRKGAHDVPRQSAQMHCPIGLISYQQLRLLPTWNVLSWASWRTVRTSDSSVNPPHFLHFYARRFLGDPEICELAERLTRVHDISHFMYCSIHGVWGPLSKWLHNTGWALCHLRVTQMSGLDR